MKAECSALSLDALGQIERAARALIEAVQSAKGTSSAQPQNSTLAQTPTVTEICNEFLMAKARAGRADRYLKTCLAQLKSFVKGREHKAACSVTSAEIEAWLYGNEWDSTTRRGYLLP